MSKPGLITLLSDFGISDVYVGVMKGVIAHIAPHTSIIDLTHQISPQNLWAGRFVLMNAYPYFPANTVHIAVVDPGVGSERRAIAVQFSQGIIVAPDNGLISGILQQERAIAAVELTDPQYWRNCSPSATFHGRDIFSPVGAYLATGVSLTAVGQSIDPNTLKTLNLPAYSAISGGVVGCIQYIDHFGNLITNIPAKAVEGKSWSVAFSDFSLAKSQTYSDRASGELVTLIGSHGWVEIAVNGGSAKERLHLDYGSEVTVYC